MNNFRTDFEPQYSDDSGEFDYNDLLEPVQFSFAIDRRSFVQIFGAGALLTVVGSQAFGQRGRRGRRGGGGPPPALSARLHLGEDGTITVLSGKVDCGQGARGEIAQAVGEELRVPLDRVRVLLADTELVPNDGVTAASGTTPRTIPNVRRAAAAVRQLFLQEAAKKWSVEADRIEFHEGKFALRDSDQVFSYAELAKDEQLLKRLAEPTPGGTELTPAADWTILGKPQPAPAAPSMVTGAHRFPSDIVRPNMLYGRVLRSPKYRANLTSLDPKAVQAMKDVVFVRDGEFVGVAAPNSFRAGEAIDALATAATWKSESLPTSDELFDYLRANADGGVPANPFAADAAKAAKRVRQTYYVSYVQHAPLEPRAAVAEWARGKLTVWCGSQNPFGVRDELKRAFQLSDGDVQVIVPDFGGGFGGKHTGETAVEAARLAREAKRLVKLRWTREEEFTRAYFRPAGLIDMEATLDEQNRLTSWWFLNISSGRQSIDIPYSLIEKKQSRSIRSKPPLREGAYRALAATGNVFARESFMDELAVAAGADPLDFRLQYLEPGRLRKVLEEAARQFKWRARMQEKRPNRGIGLACAIEKNSYVAACAEVEIEPETKKIAVRHVCQAFECGAILNPDNLRNQIEGAITMGLGPALTEEIIIADNAIENPSFLQYRVPHFMDAPTIEVHLVNRPDLDSIGAGETPIVAIAPAIGNAVFAATGVRLRKMPMKLG